MKTAFSVWQWNQYNGWTLYFGTNRKPAAAQVARALKAYDPQNHYVVSGAVELKTPHFIKGTTGKIVYEWGYSKDVTTGWIIVISLSDILTPLIKIYSDHAVADDMPNSIRYKLSMRNRYVA